MPDYGQDLRFGVFITPEAARSAEVVELAQLAELVGLDYVTFQDHPYQAKFLDTWTLLSVIASKTSRIGLAPNVASLPLRPPFVLAKSVASLDLLSGGRIELGLGAGAFWDAIAAAGGPKRTPGEGVDALSEAIDVIRQTWDEDGRSVKVEGEHYRVRGARSGPAPAHDVEIWVGAYKPRMLRLTGRKADGWLPSLSYLDLDEFGAMTATVDGAAEQAGRDPAAIRRLLNINGSFGDGGGMLEGSPSQWAEQLAALTLEHGTSTFILSVEGPNELRRFAEEVAPAVRELVAAERRARLEQPAEPGAAADQVPTETGGDASRPTTPAQAATAALAPPLGDTPAQAAAAASAPPLAATPTPPPAQRLSDEQPWDESTRPSAGEPDESRGYDPHEQAAGRHLIDVHDHLRSELERLRGLIAQVASGNTDATAVRSFLNRMTIRQNNWTLGTFCETYCRVVTNHHTLEDRSVFPHLRRSEDALAPVIDRLEQEHEVIADLLERVDQALIDLVAAEGDGIAGVQARVDLLTDALLSHFSYEERELIEPLARNGFG